jgi:hypothetical protein
VHLLGDQAQVDEVNQDALQRLAGALLDVVGKGAS